MQDFDEATGEHFGTQIKPSAIFWVASDRLSEMTGVEVT
jgi:hypothetical protein